MLRAEELGCLAFVDISLQVLQQRFDDPAIVRCKEKVLPVSGACTFTF